MTSYEELTDIKTNNKEDDISLTESALSNVNNSINTYSITNENNNTLNKINIKTRTEGFGFIEKDKENGSFEEHNDNDKIIKEIASELEQSTAKGNILCSNKKEIEKNFKNIRDTIQPINLKLNNPKMLELIDESGEKIINNNISNKSEKSASLFDNNINIKDFNINENNKGINMNNQMKQNTLNEMNAINRKFEENISNDVQENINIDKRMNLYDTKLII